MTDSEGFRVAYLRITAEFDRCIARLMTANDAVRIAVERLAELGPFAAEDAEVDARLAESRALLDTAAAYSEWRDDMCIAACDDTPPEEGIDAGI